MKVLFAALHLAYMRNFESVVRELAARGHHVHISADEPEDLGGRELVERLVDEHADITWSLLPSLEGEPWFRVARKLRYGLDYVRFLDPRYDTSPKLRVRALERTPRVVRWGATAAPRATRQALKRTERLMPRSKALEDYLDALKSDVVVLASLTYSRSQQLDLLKVASAGGIPTAAAIASWDHLSSKALVHVSPDMVLVWNDTQRREAMDMHGLPDDALVVTGAQCYDQWFGRGPARDRDAFCSALGLRADRPFVTWVHSALSPTPDPPEPALVVSWIEALRRSTDPRLRELGILVRPHPERLAEWDGVDVTRYEHVAFHGANPLDSQSKADYFDTLYHSSAVVGLVTSAFLEAAIVGRPVLTFMLPQYRIHQEQMIHFQYLQTVEGGLLQTAPDLDAHLAQLAGLVAAGAPPGAADRRFLEVFVRPFGLEQPATPVFVDALERLSRTGPRSISAAVPGAAWLRPVVAALSGQSQGVCGRYLLNALRDDQRDRHREHDRLALESKQVARAGRERAQQRQREERRRHDVSRRRKKEFRSGMRRARFRAAMLMHRVLAFAGLSRGDVSGRFRE